MSWLSRLSPVPGFPAYTGPYTVGTCDVEIPLGRLDSPAPSPDSSISTVAFRIFYPCDASGAGKASVKWLAYPHRGYVQAYAKFLGANNLFAQIFSYFPHLLYYATIPARQNAPPLQPKSESQKWPVMIFSHGLGGSRNAYSHICGSLASHGVVVIAPEHRDGSCPITYIRQPGTGKIRPIYYHRTSHTPSPEVYNQRDHQLQIRLWELGLIHDALLKIDAGSLSFSSDMTSSRREMRELNEVLGHFRGKLDVHTPGSITFAGHSFGAATMVQLVKSVCYNLQSNDPAYHALFTPTPSSSICRQITPATPVMLLDMWCLPLRSPSTKWLWSQPMPCYTASGPGGKALLAILSEAFFNWRSNLSDTRRALSEDPNSATPAQTKPAPTFFYPATSAHLSQSDFGILFPRVTKMAFKSEEPERCIMLNVRAMLQKLRDNGIQVASTSRIDMEESEKVPGPAKEAPVAPPGAKEDWRILATNGDVRGWIPIRVLDSAESESDDSSDTDKWKAPADAVVESEVLGEVMNQRAS